MMMAEELLEELRRCGVQVEARGEVLHVEAPRGALSPELVRSLRRLKPALLRLVAPEGSRTVGQTLGEVSETGGSLLTAEVCAMRLEVFARAGLVVEVWSSVLDEAVVFASDDARVDPGELRTVYRAHELRVLLGLTTPRELRRGHEVPSDRLAIATIMRIPLPPHHHVDASFRRLALAASATLRRRVSQAFKARAESAANLSAARVALGGRRGFERAELRLSRQTGRSGPSASVGH